MCVTVTLLPVRTHAPRLTQYLRSVIGLKSNFAQVTCSQCYTYSQRNLIGGGLTAPLSVIAQQYSSATFVSLPFHS